MKPHWKHDCEECIFLGTTIGGGQLVDLYVHGDTLISRRSDEGADYFSAPREVVHPTGHSELWAAHSLDTFRRANP